MSQQNEDIFVEDSETTEEDQEQNLVIPGSDWGGELINTVIPQELGLIASILGVQGYSNIVVSSTDELESEEDKPERLEPRQRKYFKTASGKRIISSRIKQFNYLRLKSGEEFNFTEDDGKNLILTESILENRLIRNILSRIPFKMSNRLEYLAMFEYDEDSDSEDELEEGEVENEKKVEKRYFGRLRDLVYEGYIKEWRLRSIFRKVLLLWRINKMNKTCDKEIDPITLAPFEKKVAVYDWDNKTKFIFEAKSIANLIESHLNYQEYGFPSPISPKNPLNNVEFSYKQLISIYNQLKEYGELKWGLITLRQYNFNKQRWHNYHKSALTINAIKTNIKLLENSEARDLLSDFIFSKMDELNIQSTQYIINAYNVAILRVPTHWYLEKFKSLAIQHYEGEHFGYYRKRIINSQCIKLFRKQSRFIKDLINKKII